MAFEVDFEQLFQRLSGELARLAYFYLHDTGEAEDVVQETFLRAYRELPRYRGEAPIEAWIRKITVNLCHDRLRSWHNKHVFADDVLSREANRSTSTTSPPPPDPSEIVTARFERDRLLSAVTQLPDIYREVIVLYYYEEMTAQEIAALLNTPATTVRSRMLRARERLARALGSGEEVHADERDTF